MLVDSIDIIISTSNQFEQGDTLDLLSQEPYSESAVNEAKDHFIKLASEKAGLTLTDLFDIRFEVVNRAGETEHFEKLTQPALTVLVLPLSYFVACCLFVTY